VKSSLPGGLNSRSPYYINDCVSLSTVAKSLVEQVWHQSLGRIWGEDSWVFSSLFACSRPYIYTIPNF